MWVLVGILQKFEAREAVGPTLTVTGRSLIEAEAIGVKMPRSEVNVEKAG